MKEEIFISVELDISEYSKALIDRWHKIINNSEEYKRRRIKQEYKDGKISKKDAFLKLL